MAKKALKLWKTLGEYIESRRGTLLLSRRALARELKMSSSYLTNVVNGNITPGADVCNRISDYFKDPQDIALRLAGWLKNESDDEDILGDAVMMELALLIRDDPDLIAFLNRYRKAKTPGEKRAMVNLILSTYGKD